MGNFEIHKSLRDLRLDKNIVRTCGFPRESPHLSFFRNNSEVKQVKDKIHFQIIYIVSRCGIEFFKSDLSIQMCPETYKYISVIE